MALTPSTMVPLGSVMPAFSLPDANGEVVSSDKYTGKPLLVMFICNHCPYVKHIAAALSEFAEEYIPAGLGIVAINSNDFRTYPEDSPARMREEIAARGYRFPYLVDEQQEVAKAFDAACTPDFFLFDHEGKLAYRGQFDGSRPGNNEPVDGSDLRAAADAVLRGEQPGEDQAPSVGCNIKWK
ncbi:thioredoxin family protein [Microbulbifer yueqingensis]|uniref:Peroxiredoxin n=1 Tax=Microbulbifer yueqingensis TaxID=658219 RepID=A0A1G8Y0K2_9GAMM|nr:thioredoxin family protein [Microbulbifer yueqingensis]SDJ96306.1 Peroxiredoxin [Microbulbifer yueqingensis]